MRQFLLFSVFFVPLSVLAVNQNSVQFPKHSAGVREMVISPDGMILASMGGRSIRLWDILRNQERSVLYDREGPVGTMEFSPDSRSLVSISSRAIHLWDVASGREIFPLGRELRGNSAAFSPQGGLLAVAHREEVDLWDIAAGRKLQTLRGLPGASSLVFSIDGRLLAVGCRNREIRLWDLESNRIRAILRPRRVFGAF